MIHVIRSGIFSVNSLIVPVEKNKVFLVDPASCKLSGDENSILDYLKKKKLECLGIVLTHCHFDHITGLKIIKENFPQAKIAIHQAEFNQLQNPPGSINESAISFFGLPALYELLSELPEADLALTDGCDYFGWKVIHTPGHSPGSICLYKEACPEYEKGALISGDTLFDYGGYGRTDLEGGNEAVIMQSLSLLKRKIPAGTLVYPGHDSFGFSF